MGVYPKDGAANPRPKGAGSEGSWMKVDSVLGFWVWGFVDRCFRRVWFRDWGFIDGGLGRKSLGFGSYSPPLLRVKGLTFRV